jgi:bifunctional non-homologous end joining protein LigD
MVIGGFTDPQGSRKGFGALLLGIYEGGKLQYSGKVGTGFDQQSLDKIYRCCSRVSRTSPRS